MVRSNKAELVAAHRPSWNTFWIWMGFVFAFFASEALLFWTVWSKHYLLAIPATLLVAHIMHSHLLAFQEAAHGVLCPNYWVNEWAGIYIGKQHLVGLSLFRAVHDTHHGHLASERDEQLWPFVNPRMTRWKRLLTAAIELSIGIFFDLFLFWR